MDPDLFGNDQQQALLRRGRSMARLLCGDPRFTYYGRTVGLASPEDGDVDTLAELTRVQGNSNFASVPEAQAEDIEQALSARGLVPVHYARWQGGRAVLDAARAAVAAHAVPGDLEIHMLDKSTDTARMAAFAKMSLACGVLPPVGEVLRGLGTPALCLIVTDPSGRVVSCAASAAFAHADHPRLGRQAWWGMLATDPARRGQRLALILGAMVIEKMHDRFGFADFFTGVEPGNTGSEAVCARMGMQRTAFATIGCADPVTLGASRMTK